MIQKEIKKKSYLKPEAEVTWMDNEDLMQMEGGSVQGTGEDQPWGNAKINTISFEDTQEEPETWEVYFGCNYEE